MKQYIELGKRILAEGERRTDRTGEGTLSVFGHNMVFDLRERFPLVTVKETRYKAAFLEMLWFLRAEGNTDYLHKHGSTLWDAWADKDGTLGPVYGCQWRSWDETHDQVHALINGLRTNRHSRRHIVSAWNVNDLPAMALPPCHWAHQCYVSNEGHLDLKVFLRSSDFSLGLPFNIAQYALLTHLYAREAWLTPRRLIVDIGDAHIYLNHVAAMRKVLDTEPLPDQCELRIQPQSFGIDAYTPEDFTVHNYRHGPFVKLEVAV